MHSRSFENSAFQMHRVNASCLGVLGVSLTFDKLYKTGIAMEKHCWSSRWSSLNLQKAARAHALIISHHLSSSLIISHYLSSHFSGSPSVMFTGNCLKSLDGLAHLSAPRLGSTGFPVAAFQLGSQDIVFIQFSTLWEMKWNKTCDETCRRRQRICLIYLNPFESHLNCLAHANQLWSHVSTQEALHRRGHWWQHLGVGEAWHGPQVLRCPLIAESWKPGQIPSGNLT